MSKELDIINTFAVVEERLSIDLSKSIKSLNTVVLYSAISTWGEDFTVDIVGQLGKDRFIACMATATSELVTHMPKDKLLEFWKTTPIDILKRLNSECSSKDIVNLLKNKSNEEIKEIVSDKNIYKLMDELNESNQDDTDV